MHNLSISLEKLIYTVRNYKVMLDQDLAKLYTVETRVLVQAVKRNLDRFPPDFCFQLSNQEFINLRSQFVISSLSNSEQDNYKHGGRRTKPYAFTEQGIAMLSSVLKSKKAAQVNVQIMRTFVQLRQFLLDNKELTRKLDYLEQKYDQQFKIIFDAIREVMNPTKLPIKPKIGFRRE